MKKIAISRSNYIRWKGYFDLINSVDEFVLYDDMQYTKRDWRNRNQIKTKNGLLWLSILIKTKSKYFQKVNEVFVDGDKWKKEHLASLRHSYAKSRFFDNFFPNLGGYFV